MASIVGYVLGTLAGLLGVAYVWLAILWLLRIKNRWPRFSLWSAIAIAVGLGLVTATRVGQTVLVLAASAGAAAVLYLCARAKSRPKTTEPTS